MNKTLILTAATAAVLTGAGLSLGAATPAAATTCSTPWGSTSKAVTTTNQGTLLAVRAGRHECFDRLVLDVNRNGLGYRVGYVKAVHDQGQGAVIALKGGAFLEIVDQSMVTKRIPMPSVAGFTTFRDVKFGGSFEGYSTVGLGVRARLPFRVTTSSGHLVIDVAHRW